MNKIIMEDAQVIANGNIAWDKLEGKSIMISGANGYVPQFFIHGLLARNDLYHSNIHIIAVCRNKERANARFSTYLERKDFELILCDISEYKEYSGSIDYIIHAASPASLKTRYANPIGIFDANVIGAKNLLELAKRKKAAFLFLSSVDIYGKGNGGRRLEEDFSGILEPLNERNIYSCAKRATETLCKCYCLEGTECKIVRPYQIVGSGLELDDGRLHIDFISQILKSGRITLKGDGSPKRTFLYITDAILGMLTVMLEGESGEAYNVVWENNEASVLELAQMMASLVKGKNIEITYNMETRKNDPAVTQAISMVCGDSSKIQKLGWKAQIGLQEACSRMMSSYGINV